MADAELRIRPAGDAAIILELPARMDEETSRRAVALGQQVRARLASRLRDVVVGYHTVTVYFDPARQAFSEIHDELGSLAAVPASASLELPAHVDVPVCYGGDLGPDLAEVAATLGRSEEEIIALHASREYRVFVIGFVPGFAYMGPLAPELSPLGRRAAPRTRVPAGSVAIAAGQTGIYPMETPGGWWLLGRTPVRPFDPARTPPVLFAPGDRVRFTPISRADFGRMTDGWGN